MLTVLFAGEIATTEGATLLEELFTYENLVHAISGMTGGVTAITTFYPLNVVRTRLQVDESIQAESNVFKTAAKIAEKHGIQALYQVSSI